jgi:hypothetical protein
MGGRRRSRRRASKKSSRRRLKKSRKNIRRRRRTSRRRKMRGGVNSDILGDQSTSVANITSKMLGTPFTPSTTWDQPANYSHGPGNQYLT